MEPVIDQKEDLSVEEEVHEIVDQSPPTDGKDKKDAFAVWLESQPDEVKALYASHVTGLTSALDKERTAAKEARKLAKKVADFEAAEAQRNREKLSENEKLQEDLRVANAALEKARADLATTKRKTAITSTAMKLGFADPSDAISLLNLSELEIDEESGDPTNAEALLKALLVKKPYLKGKTTQNGDGNQSRHDLQKKGKPEKIATPKVVL